MGPLDASIPRRLFAAAVLLAAAFAVRCSPAHSTRPPATDPSLAAETTLATQTTEAAEIAPPPPNGGWLPSWSPDGSWIAFKASSPHTPSDLWVMRANGLDARRLTTRGAQAFRWSADGNSIQIATRRRGFDEVLSVDTSSGAESRVVGVPPAASVPVYSPDGKLLAFTVPGEKKVRDLWIATTDGSRSEAVTESLGVRSVFWGADSRRIYFEPGKAYGIGLWELDLATMESRVILNTYVGTPRLSPVVERIAYPFPTNPGEFAVHTCKPDGSDEQKIVAPHLGGRSLAWDGTGTGIFYLGEDAPEGLAKTEETTEAEPVGDPDVLPPGHTPVDQSTLHGSTVTSLWRLDLAEGTEVRISPPDLHVVDFMVSPDGTTVVLSGLLPDSTSSDIFQLDLSEEKLTRLVSSRPSSWMPVANRESSKIAYFTNESGGNSIEVVTPDGEHVATYPGVAVEETTRMHWLPESGALLLFSPRGILAFNEDGPIAFPNRKDFRAHLYADVSIRSDKVLISALPRFGVYPGLYMLEAVDSSFELTDLRYPPAPEVAAELYLQPRWSFDEQRIAFSDRTDLWVMNGDGSDRKWITDFAATNTRGASAPTVVTHPVWSVNGEWIAHIRLVFGEELLQRQLWVIHPDGTDARMLHSEPVDDAFVMRQEEFTNAPFFDLSGERLIFTATDSGVPNLFAVGIDGGEVQRLTTGGALFPILLPEDDLIIYASIAEGNESLWVMNGDGSGKRPFLPSGGSPANAEED